MDMEKLEQELFRMGKFNMGKSVTIFLMNGFQMRGEIEAMYDEWLTLEDGKDQRKKIIFYHAISTID